MTCSTRELRGDLRATILHVADSLTTDEVRRLNFMLVIGGDNGIRSASHAAAAAAAARRTGVHGDNVPATAVVCRPAGDKLHRL